MRWLLDTCVVSELTRKVPEPRVVSWLTAHGDDACITLVTIGELQYGIERMPAGRNRNAMQFWFDGLGREFADRTVATDEPVWRAFGRLKASLDAIGQPQEDMDVLIAAAAAVNHLTVVTRNIRHFEESGVQTLNPWLAATPAD